MDFTIREVRDRGAIDDVPDDADAELTKFL